MYQSSLVPDMSVPQIVGIFLPYFSLGVFKQKESIQSALLSYACQEMKRNALTVWLVGHVTSFFFALDKQLSVFWNPASSPSKISICVAVTFFMWFILLSRIPRPLLPLHLVPLPSAWQSQPLFLQWEAAFFQRDDLLCLYRGWHWGHDPPRWLDSTRRMLWMKSTSCHPNAAHMCAKHKLIPEKENSRDPSVHPSWCSQASAPLSGPLAQNTGSNSVDHHSFLWVSIWCFLTVVFNNIL